MARRRRLAECHPERLHRGLGLCSTCYDTARRRRRGQLVRVVRDRSACHPDRPHHALGLCVACYNRRRSPESRRKWLLSQYGLTPAAFDELVAAQKGKCTICGRTPKRLRVDHDHAAGHVRGLLCNDCNRGLGMFGDDPTTVEAAAAYLSRRTLRKIA